MAGTTAAAILVVPLVQSSPAAAIGVCTTNWTGGAGNGLWATATNWDNGVPVAASVACIPDVGAPGVDVDITLPGSITVAGIDNSERIIQPASSTVTLAETPQIGEIVNRGVWRFNAAGGSIALQGTSGTLPERFTNLGMVQKTGASSGSISNTVRFDNSGAIDVQAGHLTIGAPGSMGAATYQVAAGTTLTFASIGGLSQWQGAHDATGGGTVGFSGVVDSFGMQWAFGPGETTPFGAVVDTTNGSFEVTGTLPTASATIRGDNFVVAAGGTVIQGPSQTLTLAPGVDVHNLGTWRFDATGGSNALQGTSGAEAETFTNHAGATVEKTGPSSGSISNTVAVTNLGTVHAAAGILSIGVLEQISGTTLTGGTYFADSASITLPSNIATIGFDAAVHLGGTGTMPQVNGLTSNTGVFRLSGGKDFTTTAALNNSGVVRTGPGSTLTVTGAFTNSGTYRTEIAGTPASGQYGFLTATGAATLGGTFAVTTDAAFTPVFGDAYDVVRYASRNGTFDTHAGIDPFYRRAYDPGTTNLLRLSVGQGPVASAGGPYLLDEGGPAVQLDSSLSADPDGTIVGYAWTPAAGLNNPASPTPSLTPPNDNTTYDITLTVTDDDALEDSDTATVTVQNVPPVITGVTLPATANEGSPVNLHVTFTDQGTADTHVALINWGDVSGHSDAATSPLDLQHTYTEPGNYTVDVCIQDDDLGQVCTERSITISNVNVPPQITPIGTPYHVSEGNSIFPNYNLSDPDGPNPLTYSWSVPAGTPATFSDTTDPFPTLNTTDDASFSMTLDVCDAGTPAACGTATFPVVVANAPPHLPFFSVPSVAEVDESITADYWSFDPGNDPVTVTFDWGDGTQPGTSPTHTYTAQGTYTVTACPSDGAVTGPCASDTVTVGDPGDNTAPNAVNDATGVTAGSSGNPISVLSNDFDPDGDPFTITGFQNPSAQGGTVTCSAVTCTYSPAAGFTGTDTFTYTITDQPANGTPLTDTATVTVTVGANQPPVAANDTATVASGSEDNTIFVLDNDSDPDPGDSIAITQFQNPSAQGGTVSCSTTPNFGTCTYTPAAGFTGTDTFTYTIEDEADVTDTATVTITVQPNQAPVAVDDAFTVTPTTQGRVLQVLLNDSDPEFDALTITSVQSPTTAGGTVTCTATVCTYVPPSGPSSDTFTYTVSDGELTDTATVTITLVDCANPAPAFGGTGGLLVGHRWIECPAVAANGVVTTSPTTIMGVDADGGLLMTSGSVANASGPNDSTGTTASWGTSVRGARDVSILRLDLQVPAGAACLAFDFTFGSEEYPEFVGSFNDAVLAELDTSSWVMNGNDITAPHNFALDGEGGVVSVNGTFFDPGRVIVGGGWEYDGATARLTARTPITPGAHSLFLSIFDANDTALDSGALIDNLRTGATTCTGGVNQPPVAVDDTATTPEDTPVDIAVLANDTDADPGDTLSAIVLTQPANGTASLNANGTVKFTPDANWFGTTSFTYRVTDSAGNSDTGVVTVAVTPVNDAPDASAGPDRVTVEGSPVTVAGAVTDVDSGPATLTWSIVSGPSVTTPPSGTFSSTAVAEPAFTPKENGTYVLQLAACDDAPLCDPTPDTVTVMVSNVAPNVMLPADRMVDAGAATSVTVTFTDPGVNDTHTAVIDWGDGTADTTVDLATSPFEVAHTFTAAGPHTVEGCVTDDDGGVDCDTMIVTVEDGGIAVDDEAETDEDVPVEIFVLTNDVDPEGDLLEITGVSQPVNGHVDINDEVDPEVEDTVVFTPTLNFFGTTSFTYTVDDGNGPTDTATVTVLVGPVPDEPVVVTGADVQTVEGSAVAVAGSASDVDGPLPLSYQWVILEGPEVSEEPSGTFTDPTDPTTEFTPKQDGTYVLQLEACDGDGLCDTDPADDTVEVTVTNAAPVVTLPADRTVPAGVSTSVTVTFTDPGTDDTHSAVIDWGDGTEDTIDPAVSGFTATHTYTATGPYTVQACVSDGLDEGCDSMTVTVVPPTTLSIRDAAVREPDSGTAPMTFTITASPTPTAPVTVVAKTVNGSAKAPSDYTALPAAGHTVTFAAGQATRTVTVPIVGDLLREANESFTVTLSNPVGATIGDGSALGRITNNDVCTILGTAAAETLTGTAGNDVICGLGGNDVINGLGGNDTVTGGDGNDTIRGGTGNDTVRGQNGDDVINGEAGNDVIDGGAGIDEASWAGAPGAVTADLTSNVATGWGSDTLATLERARGGSFNDILRGNGLRNSLWGGDGNDTLQGRSADDVVDGQNGNDTIGGGPGNDTVQGRSGNDVLTGDAGNDDLRGDDGNDKASGGDGNDRVDGGNGVDLVKGDAGNDQTFGGAGNDNSPNGTTAGVHGGTGTNTVNGGTGTDYCSRRPTDTRTSCELP